MSKPWIRGTLVGIAAVFGVSAQAESPPASNKVIDRPYYTVMMPGKEWVRAEGLEKQALEGFGTDVHLGRKPFSPTHTVFAVITVEELTDALQGHAFPTRLQVAKAGWDELEAKKKGSEVSPRFEWIEGYSAVCEEFNGWCFRLFYRVKDFAPERIRKGSPYLIMQNVIYFGFHPYRNDIALYVSYSERGREDEISDTDDLFAQAKAFLDGVRPKRLAGTPPAESMQAYGDPALKRIEDPLQPFRREYYTVMPPGPEWMMVENVALGPSRADIGFQVRRSFTQAVQMWIEVRPLSEESYLRYGPEKAQARRELLHAGKELVVSNEEYFNEDPRTEWIEGDATLCDEFDGYCVRVYESWKDLPTTRKGEYYLIQQRVTYAVIQPSHKEIFLHVFYMEQGRPGEVSDREKLLADAKAFFGGVRPR